MRGRGGEGEKRKRVKVPAQYEYPTSSTAADYGRNLVVWRVERGGRGEGVTTISVTGDSHDAFPLKMSPTAAAKEKAWVRVF